MRVLLILRCGLSLCVCVCILLFFSTAYHDDTKISTTLSLSQMTGLDTGKGFRWLGLNLFWR